MIFLRTQGTDDTPASTSVIQVSIPQPIGLKDGDLLLVAISGKTPAANTTTINAPDTTWTKINQTDTSFGAGIAIFWKIALNEPSRWVFPLVLTGASPSRAATGIVLAFGGADGLAPIEANAYAYTDGSTTVAIAANSASLNDEFAIFFAGTNLAGSNFTTASSYNKAISANQAAGSSLTAQYKQLTSAGAVPATSSTIASAAKAASISIILAPNQGKRTVQDVFDLIVKALPRGVENVYDLAPGGDYYKYYMSWAQVLKTYGFDLVDLARQEIVPYLSRYKLADWEILFGLTQTRVARTGTIPQRQLQVLSAWRAAAGQGSSRAAIQAALVPIFGYFPTTVPQIIEASRASLTTLHTYVGGAAVIPAGDDLTVSLTTTDGGKVSKAGIRLGLIITHPSIEDLTIELDSTVGGVSKTWTLPGTGSVTAQEFVLYGREFADLQTYQQWNLSIIGSGSVGSLDGWYIVVEGIGPNLETGGAIFTWGVYADPAHLGENGTPADLDAARRLIEKFSFDHTRGTLLQSISGAYPDVTTGAHAAIPDECLPA